VKKKTRVPSFSKIIATDYPAFLASLIPIFLFFLYLVFLIVQRSLTRPLLPQALNAIVYTLIAITVLVVFYMLYRAWVIRRVFQHGSEVQGKVIAVEFRRVGGRVGYSYSFGQKRINSGAALRLSAHTRTLRKGDRVLVVVDHDNPKRAFVRDLYR
jgi:hypothetical protein